MIPPCAKIPSAIYHGPQYAGWWSNSMLKDFRRSPALAWGRYVANSIPKRGQTSSMVFGSLVHTMLLLEQDEWPILICESGGRRSKAFAQAVEENPDQMVVEPAEFDEASEACKRVLVPTTQAGEIALGLLTGEGGHSEYPIFWERQSVPLKASCDRLTYAMGRPAVVEVKTTVDPSPDAFAKQAWNLDYHCQAALYSLGALQLLHEEPLYFWVAIRNEPPFEVAVYPISSAFLELGMAQVDKDVRTLAEFLKLPASERWTAEWEEPETLMPLDPPRWAVNKDKGGAIYDSF